MYYLFKYHDFLLPFLKFNTFFLNTFSEITLYVYLYSEIKTLFKVSSNFIKRNIRKIHNTGIHNVAEKQS